MARPLYEIRSRGVRCATAHRRVAHLDEEFPHVHFYAIPKDYEMWNACRGDKASKETNSKLEAKKAMQAYQDAYYEGVRPLRAHTIRPASPTTDAGQWKAQKAHAGV